MLSSPNSAGRGFNGAVHLPLPRPNLGVPSCCREPRSSCWAEVAGSGTSPMGGDRDPAPVPPSLVALAICSHESGRACYLGAPGWHLSRVGDLRMGTSARDAGGKGRRVSGQGDGTCPPPATCPGLPGHAGTCLAVRSPLSVCSDCPEIGSWISIFTRGAESERRVPTGVATGTECGPPAPGLGTAQLPTGTLGW